MKAVIEVVLSEQTAAVREFVKDIAESERINFVGDLEQTVIEQVRAHSAVGVFDEGENVLGFGGFETLVPYKLVETRSCFVAPELRGLGLQRLLHYARATLIVDRWGPDCAIVSATKETSPFARRNLKQLGFVSWENPAMEVYATCAACPSRPARGLCCCGFHRCDPHGVKRLSACLTDEAEEFEAARRRNIDMAWGTRLRQIAARAAVIARPL